MDVEDMVADEERLLAVEHELKQVSLELRNLSERKKELEILRDKLKDKMNLEKSKQMADKNWDTTDFPLYSKLLKSLKDVFKIEVFRPYQLPTMNATLAKEDVILIMPTGGGKSLTYQLTALVDKGFTLVVSPLLSLMEDQVIALRALNIQAGMFHSQSTKEETNMLMTALTDLKSPVKLVYATPEKLAKSKRFMSKLQKAYQMGRLARIAIDEVHCCSTWGHDFRPDYKFLGVLKPMFPDVPMLGLTATATTKVIVDVQKMLEIQGCIVFKATFNRPNLMYEVRPKPKTMDACLDQLTNMLKQEFANKSGIIYTTTIKDCEELRDGLRKGGCRVSAYHANLDAAIRSKVHHKWLSGEYQAVVATIAFGLGIDKPNVRFVIHHSLSKSMENYYQESGRAGRDGQPARCIVFYRLADIFKLSTMVFTQQTGLQCLYGMVEYCIDVNRCRREMIAGHFDEVWDKSDCQKMCDHCLQPKSTIMKDITVNCRSLYRLITHAAASDTKLTALKLMDAWYGRGAAGLRLPDLPSPGVDDYTGEVVIAYLLAQGYLREDFHFTPYSTISYIRQGPNARKFDNPKHTVKMPIAGHAKITKDSSTAKSDECKSVVNGTCIKTSDSSKRKRLSVPENQKPRKVYVIDSDSD